MKKICVLLPTYRGVDCIEYFLDSTIKSFYKCDIDVYLYDSSNTDSVANLSKKYINRGFSNLFYEKWNSLDNPADNASYEVFSNPDLKVFQAMKELKTSYDYIWLTGDNCVLNIDLLIDDVFAYLDKQYDIIHFSNGREMDKGNEKEYSDARELYKNDIWHLTAYGASIISTKLVDYICSPIMLEKYLGSGFLYVMSIFEYCANYEFKAIHSQRDFHKKNIYRKESGWVLSGDALAVFGKNWVEANLKLPALYDDLKAEAIKSNSNNTGLFGYGRCVYLRATGNISFEKIKKYTKYLSYITDTSIIWMYFLALLPKKLVNTIWSIYVRK